MSLFPLAMPGALRLRSLQPLTDGDGICSLVYDVERAAVFEVPEDLKLYVAPALDTGNLDEELLGWLASADLLTAESAWDASGCEPGIPAGHPWFDAADPAQSPSLQYGGDEVHGWIDQPEAAAAIAAVERVFKRGRGSSRIKLHLDWTGNLPADGRLERVVMAAGSSAALAGQEVAFELVLDPEQVTAEVAGSLAAQPVHVRLRCGECDPEARRGTRFENRPWLLAEPALQLLLEQMAAAMPGWSRLTVQCILEGPARLIELWRWAGAAGVQSLDAIRLEDPGAGRGARAREYRQDLDAICEATCAELEAGRSPVEFQPLLRIVRRLRCSEAAVAAAAGCGDLAAPGGGRTLAGFESLDPRLLPEQLWRRLEGPARQGSPVPPCQACWARRVCNHSVYVASPLGKEDPRDPSRERCAFWSAEVEMAARLHHRLSQIDATQVWRFFADAPGAHPLSRPPWKPADDGEALSSKPS